MKVQVGALDFIKQLKKCCDVIPASTASPMLQNVKLKVGPEGMFLTSTDFESFVTSQVSILGSATGKEETVLFNAKKLLEIVSAFDGSMTVEVKDCELFATSSKRSMSLRGFPAFDFPEYVEKSTSEVASIMLSAKTFTRMIEHTVWCLPEKNNIENNFFYFRAKNNTLSVYVTDTKHLAKYCVMGFEGEEFTFVIPYKTLAKMYKHGFTDEEIVIDVKNASAIIKADRTVYSIRVASAPFMEFETFLTPLPSNKAQIDTKEMFGDIKSLMAITAEDNFVSINIKENIEKGYLLIEAKNGAICSGSVKTAFKDIYGEIEGRYNAKPVFKALDCIASPLIWVYNDECNQKMFITSTYEDGEEIYTALISPLIKK